MAARRDRFDRLNHWYTLVVLGDDQQRSLGSWIRCGLRLTKRWSSLGHLTIAAFQCVHRRTKAQHDFQGVSHQAECLFHSQQLVPLLQQVRQLAFRQLQPLIGRRQLDLLAVRVPYTQRAIPSSPNTVSRRRACCSGQRFMLRPFSKTTSSPQSPGPTIFRKAPSSLAPKASISRKRCLSTSCSAVPCCAALASQYSSSVSRSRTPSTLNSTVVFATMQTASLLRGKRSVAINTASDSPRRGHFRRRC